MLNNFSKLSAEKEEDKLAQIGFEEIADYQAVFEQVNPLNPLEIHDRLFCSFLSEITRIPSVQK